MPSRATGSESKLTIESNGNADRSPESRMSKENPSSMTEESGSVDESPLNRRWKSSSERGAAMSFAASFSTPEPRSKSGRALPGPSSPPTDTAGRTTPLQDVVSRRRTQPDWKALELASNQ